MATAATAPAATVDDAIRALRNAWRMFEPRGLEFGKSCWTLREALKASGKRMKGDGVSPILEQLKIPSSTFYWWVEKYEVSQGLRTIPAAETNDAVTTALNDPAPDPESDPRQEPSSVTHIADVVQESDTTKYRRLFAGTTLILNPSTVRTGLESVAGKYDLCGLTLPQLRIIAKALEARLEARDDRGD